MDRQETIVVVDDSVSNLTKTNLYVDNRFVEVVTISSDHLLEDQSLRENATLISLVWDSVKEENIMEIIKLSNGNFPLLCYRETPPLKELGKLILSRERMEEDEKEDALVERLMSESLEYYRLASVYQQSLKIITSQDLEKLLSTIADAFLNELKVESCVLWLSNPEDPDEFTIAAVRGLINIDTEGSRFYLSKMDFYESANETTPFEYVKNGSTHLYVPLTFRETPVGLLKLGKKLTRKPFNEKEKSIVKTLSDYCAIALKNLERIQKLEKVTLIDPETRVYSETFFRDFFEKESSKSMRFGRPLSVIYFTIDNYGHLLSNLKETIVHERVAYILQTMGTTLRDSDLISRIRTDRFCILLPETDYLGSLITIKRIRKAVRSNLQIDYLDKVFQLSIMMRSVSFITDGKTLDELLFEAEKKFMQLRKSPVHKYQLYDKGFWDIFDIIVGEQEKYENREQERKTQGYWKVKSDYGRNRYFSIDSEEYAKIVEVMAQDICLNRSERGILILAGPRPEFIRQILSSFEVGTVPSKKIYILGRQAIPKFDSKNVLIATVDDEKLDSTNIAIYLKEKGSFGFLSMIRNGKIYGFNTSDEVLVETLYEKLQEIYMIQGTF